MDKEQLFQELNFKLSAGEITREEVSQRLGIAQVQENVTTSLSPEEEHHFSVTKMLYVMGAGIVLVGIFIFMAQIWDDMGSFSRIVITLGLGFLLTALGSVLSKQTPGSKIGVIFHFIGGMMIPGGALVTLNEFNLRGDWMLSLAFITIFAFYLILTFVHKHAILTFFAIANGTAAIYLSAYAALDPVLGYHDMVILYQYLTIALGGSYLFMARSFAIGWNTKLVVVLSFAGITGLLGAAFFRVLDSGLWELFYFVIVFGGLLLSVYMKSRTILVMSTIFLLIHVSYITSEYFADSLGWPIVLVILGFIFIGLGYTSLTINNRYIKQSDSVSLM